MKVLIIVLLVLVFAVLLGKRKKAPDEGTPVCAGPAPEVQASVHQELLNRIENCMDQDLFSLMIQPMVDFKTGTAYCGEVLSRLYLPERGMIFPDQFLPVVDALGLYPRFDRYIFRKCCAWIRRSVAEGERIDNVSCNFSRKTLSEAGLVRDLIQIADGYGIPYNQLGVEITEREKETDMQQMVDNLKQLREAGFRVILDDYGTGVTSANNLTQFPLDMVKIDRSMLLNTSAEKGIAEFCELVSMAAELGLTVVCEGIETQEQSQFARKAGCHYGQGFLFFQPASQDQVFELLHKSSILEDVL